MPVALGDLPRTILIAEDEHLLAANLTQNLSSLGFEIIGPAATGVQAVELAKQHNPQMALLDIRMPEKNGLEAAGVLFCQMGIPVVIISAFSDPDYLHEGARIGVFGYLLKPVQLDDLRVSITVAWSRYRQHTQLREEVATLKVTLEERKIIERAKGLIMQRLGLSEEAAMKRLQKQARDSRRKLADLARAILETSDLFETNLPPPSPTPEGSPPSHTA